MFLGFLDRFLYRPIADSRFPLDPPTKRNVITFVPTFTMVLELKLRKVGNSVGVVLPKEALARLNSGEGDMVVLTDSPDGSFRLASDQADFGRQMKVAEVIIGRYRNALRELAK
jgi:putative addiction module antidote